MMQYHFDYDSKRLYQFKKGLEKYAVNKPIEINGIVDDGTNPINHILRHNRKKKKHISYRFTNNLHYVYNYRTEKRNDKKVELYDIYADVQELSGIELSFCDSDKDYDIILSPIKKYAEQQFNYKNSSMDKDIISLEKLKEGFYALNVKDRKLSLDDIQNYMEEYQSCFELVGEEEYQGDCDEYYLKLAKENTEALEYLKEHNMFSNFIPQNKIKLR